MSCPVRRPTTAESSAAAGKPVARSLQAAQSGSGQSRGGDAALAALTDGSAATCVLLQPGSDDSGEVAAAVCAEARGQPEGRASSGRVPGKQPRLLRAMRGRTSSLAAARQPTPACCVRACPSCRRIRCAGPGLLCNCGPGGGGGGRRVASWRCSPLPGPPRPWGQPRTGRGHRHGGGAGGAAAGQLGGAGAQRHRQARGRCHALLMPQGPGLHGSGVLCRWAGAAAVGTPPRPPQRRRL